MRKRRVLLAAFIAFLGNLKAFPPSFQAPAEKTSVSGKVTLEVVSGPVSKDLVISFTETASPSTVTITDLKGAKLLSQSVETGLNKASINVSKLSAGTYFVVLTNQEGRTSKVFVKQ
ncbi:T9SS type A sorting domain-containing protein [Desertivirga arenae]|uniref:T9SS type A sorting domain-containing protein n=1 Tax=Desertivirga arenae TaxID=2810309 RepID=UPI001A95D0BE|nr:T9SS type A sorting domain-containing protein [Pedobacter sp. SYSU D00823]